MCRFGNLQDNLSLIVLSSGVLLIGVLLIGVLLIGVLLIGVLLIEVLMNGVLSNGFLGELFMFFPRFQFSLFFFHHSLDRTEKSGASIHRNNHTAT